MSNSPGALMEAEIAEQGQVWLNLAQSNEIDRASAFIQRVAPRVVILAARGTSDHAAIYGQYLMQAKLRLPAYLATPALATVYDAASFPPGALLIALSQSGESPDLRATVAAAQAAGVPTLAITNNPASPLAQDADEHLDLGAGIEHSVAATKSYTAELIALYCVIENLRKSARATVLGSVSSLAHALEKHFPRVTEHANAIAANLRESDRVLVVGRGFSYASAKEGALKLMETSSIAASGWSAADALHGPLGQVVAGTPVVLLTGSRAGRDSVFRLVESLRTKAARIEIIATDRGAALRGVTTHQIVPQEIEDELIPAFEIVVLQLAALSLSRSRGLDADRPTGLSKVTLTH